MLRQLLAKVKVALVVDQGWQRMLLKHLKVKADGVYVRGGEGRRWLDVQGIQDDFEV